MNESVLEEEGKKGRVRPMKKRLRKKWRVSAFQALGFEVHFQIANDLSDDVFARVADAFISQAIEAHGLICGGGEKKPEWSVFVTLDRRGSATEEHRHAVQHWRITRPEVKEFQLGPLVDAWYPAQFDGLHLQANHGRFVHLSNRP